MVNYNLGIGGYGEMGILERFCINSRKDNFRETAVYALGCAYSHIEKEISDHLRPFNLTPAKFNAMMVIKHTGKEEGLSQIEIGRRLIVTASNMTRLLDKLEKEGYIERLAREGDRRVNLIKISKKGSDILDKVWPGYRRKVVDIANSMDKEDLKQMSHLLVKWCDKLG
jgi:MarR family 2-MHQ and catechol resistance regulon transcriptional repressor